MRLVFAGTPEPAVPSLRALLASDHEVVAVLTRPDARAGRGRTLVQSSVRQVAEEAGIEVLTPASARDPQLAARLEALAPQACAVVAYGALIPAPVLAIPTHGWVNLHFSLLPAWRGAAPVQRALMAGDEMTGASTFLLEEGLDTGPVLGTLTEPILSSDTAGSLLERLSEAGAGLLVASLDGLADGSVQPVPQPGEGVSLAPKLTVEEARITWSRPAYAVDRHVRGCTPAPGAWTIFRHERLKVQPLQSVDPGAGGQPLTDRPTLAPGELLVARRAVLVGTGTDPVELGMVQAHGKKAMRAIDWARGARIETGEVLSG